MSDKLIHICTIANDLLQYEKMKASFLAAGFGVEHCRYSLFDNSQANAHEPYSTLNAALAATSEPYLLFCHQDVLLNQGHDFQHLRSVLEHVNACYPDWAVAGNAGIDEALRVVRRITDPHGGSLHAECLPAQVYSLDENFFLVNTASGVRCSADLRGFHFYATDLCLDAFAHRQSCFVIDFHLTHLSEGNAHSQEFQQARQELQRVWSRRFLFRYVKTPTTTIFLSRYSVLRRLFGSGRLTVWFVRHPHLLRRFNQLGAALSPRPLKRDCAPSSNLHLPSPNASPASDSAGGRVSPLLSPAAERLNNITQTQAGGMPPDLTISLINHSNPEMLRDCLRSIYAATRDCALEIRVVDNATGGRLVPEIQAEFPHVKWIFNSKRLGFSANHNQALRQASGRHACILNDDTLIHEGALDTLVHYLNAHPCAGMAGAKLLNRDGSLQNCAFHFMTLLSELWGICFLPASLCRLKTGGIAAAQFGKEPVAVDWVLGACIVVRAETLAQIGLLDSELSPLANTEEVDWCYRARQHGWQVAYCPQAVITHFGGQSLGKSAKGADAIRVEMYRTRIAFFRKHYGRVQAGLLRLIYAVTLPWNILMLTQSLLRRRLSPSEFRIHLATLSRIAIMSALTRARFSGKTTM